MGQGETVVKETPTVVVKVADTSPEAKVPPPTQVGGKSVDKEPEGKITILVYEDKPNVVTIEGKMRGNNMVRVKRDLTRAYFNWKKAMAMGGQKGDRR